MVSPEKEEHCFSKEATMGIVAHIWFRAETSYDKLCFNMILTISMTQFPSLKLPCHHSLNPQSGE